MSDDNKSTQVLKGINDWISGYSGPDVPKKKDNTALQAVGRVLFNLKSPTSEVTTAQRERASDMVKNFLVGGATTGLGVGGVVALTNLLKSEKEDEEALDPERLDDDTLYLPNIKSANEEAPDADNPSGINPWLAPGLGLTGGIISGVAGYAIVNKIHDAILRKRRRKLLDQAQNATLGALSEELGKKANPEQFTTADALTSLPIALPSLALIASAALTYMGLKKTFPTIKKTKKSTPARIRLVDTDTGQSDALDTDEYVKEASMEFLIRQVADIRRTADKPSDCDAIIRAMAHGGRRHITKIAMDQGIDAALDAAHDYPDATGAGRVLGALIFSKSAYLREAMSYDVLAEAADTIPAHVAMVSGMDDDRLSKVANVCADLAVIIREGVVGPLVKDASAVAPQNQEELMRALEVMSMQEEEANRDSSMATDTTGATSEDHQGGSEDDKDLEEDSGKDDTIDGVLGSMEQGTLQPNL